MRIDPQNATAANVDSNRVDTNRVSDTQSSQTSGTRSNSTSSAGQADDTVQLSSLQGTVRLLASQLNGVPDVRAEKVDALRAQVQAGTFQRSKQDVAAAIVNEHFGNGSTT